MGASTALIAAGLSLLIVGFSIGSMFLYLHKLEFRAVVGVLEVFDLQIHPMWVTVDKRGMCHLLRSVKASNRRILKAVISGANDKWWCQEEDTHDLRGVVANMCHPLGRMLFGDSVCSGLEWAFWAGGFLLVVVVCNALVVQGVAAFLLAQYANKPSASTRRAVSAAVMVGLISLLLAIGAYIILVNIPLDQPASLIQQATFSENYASGFGYGIVLLIMAFVAQAVQLLLCYAMAGSHEVHAGHIKYDGEQGYGAAAAPGVMQVTDITIRPVASPGVVSSW